MTTASTLARAGLIVSGAFLVSRVLGWLRLVVIANAVGDPRELDAFFAAFRIPDLLFQLVAAGALSSALIPVVASVIATDGFARAWRVVSTVANLMLVALVVLAVIVLVFADRLVPLYTAGFDPVTMARTIELTRIMVLSPIFLALGSVATSTLNTQGRFAAAAIAPIVYNLAIIGAALLLTPSLGAVGLAVGVVAGSLGHLLVQIRPLQRLGFRYTPRIEVSDPAARRALTLMAPRAVGLGASQITFVVVTALATTVGLGAVTAFTIAFTLLQIPIGVIGVPLGVVLFPSLSRGAAIGDHDQFIGLLNRAMRLLAVVMIPVAALAAIVRTETVALLFGGFEANAIRLTADTFLPFLIGAPAHAVIAVLARAFYARQDTVTPVLAAIGAVVVNTTLAAALVGPFGLPGMAFAIAVAAWLEAGTLTVLLRRREGPLGLEAVTSVATRTLVATALAALVGVVTHLAIGPALAPDPATLGRAGIPGMAAVIVLVSIAFGAVFVASALALRVAELRSIVGIMVDALRRPRPA
ncbi:MAG TPA: murein biosynthesis integral membrane protein MurJ [Candidatus Limnocylindrales bacterium]